MTRDESVSLLHRDIIPAGGETEAIEDPTQSCATAKTPTE